jgi:hypothetical protein
MQKITSSFKLFILSSNLPPFNLCCPGQLHHFPNPPHSHLCIWSKPSRISHSLMLHHEEDITTFHIVMVLENYYGGHCAKIPVRWWCYTIRNVQVLDRSWEFDTLFILSSSPSSCIHGIILWHIIFSLPFNLLPQFLCRYSKNLQRISLHAYSIHM